MKTMKYEVRYEDSSGNPPDIEYYETKEAAEAAISEQFENVKEYFYGRDYEYGDYQADDGLVTEIFVSEDKDFARWIRLWVEPEEVELCTFSDTEDDYCKVFRVSKDWLVDLLERYDSHNNNCGVDLDNFLENYTWNETESIYLEAKSTGKILWEEVEH